MLQIRSQAWPVISDKKMLATGYKEWFPHLTTKFERGTEENGRTYWLELSYRATACGLLVTFMFKQSADRVTQLLSWD